MVDTGCLSYSVIDERLARNNKLNLTRIEPLTLQLANGKTNSTINYITQLNLDIDGRKESVWSYIVPNLSYSMILGKPWLEKNDVIYLAKKRCLRFGSRKHGLLVRSSNWYESQAPRKVRHQVAPMSLKLATLTTGSEFAELVSEARKTKDAIIGAVTMHDIAKALQPKSIESLEEVRNNLPEEIQKYADLFTDDDAHNNTTLPPHRKGIDTKITLIKDEQGREKEVPWGPLYGMSRGELLVLGEHPFFLRRSQAGV